MSAGGFDCVIGNPPYDVMEKERGGASFASLPSLVAYAPYQRRLPILVGWELRISSVSFLCAASNSFRQVDGLE